MLVQAFWRALLLQGDAGPLYHRFVAKGRHKEWPVPIHRSLPESSNDTQSDEAEVLRRHEQGRDLTQDAVARAVMLLQQAIKRYEMLQAADLVHAPFDNL
ncbi:hypothetical protein OIV83_000782 [Microbotryomycetes sp. JL201]|nr:hypothetical protein OIV83_000782 [Microbotryomycetes sp. JL201]